MTMTFAHPLWLSLLFAVVALAVLAWGLRARAWRQQAGAGFGNPALCERVGQRRVVLRAVLLWSGLALCMVALCGPRWGAQDGKRSYSGADVMLLLDCSRSMLAADLSPNRLTVARHKAIDLLDRSPETRLGLMPFAGIATLRSPFTGDHEAMRSMLDDCDPELFPADQGLQGTAIGDAVQQALTVLNRQVERGQAILLLSDGADPDADAVKTAGEAAKAAGIPVFGLFLGDASSHATITIDGEERTVPAERTTLDNLATATGGIAVNATTDDADVRALIERIAATVGTRPWEERRRIVAAERYQWFLLPGLALLAMGALVPSGRRARVVTARSDSNVRGAA